MPATHPICIFRVLAAITFALSGVAGLTVRDAGAQLLNDEDIILRGVVTEDGRTPAERRRDIREADLRDDGEEAATGREEEPETDTLVTGAVAPVEPVERAQLAGVENPRQQAVENPDRLDDPDPYEAVGIRAGRFILRPTVTQQIGYEQVRDDETRTERTVSRTTLTAEIVSDWELHEFKLAAEQVFDITLSGDGPESPSTAVDAELRLDLTRTMTANLAFGYDFYREDQSDANSVQDAVAQSDVHALEGRAALEKTFGTWMTRATFVAAHAIYGDVELADGTELDQSDRNNGSYRAKWRIGAATGAVMRPFVDGEYTRTVYDETIDVNGFERSSNSFALRAGVAFDRGEKLNGELAAGYIQRNYDDAALDPIRAFAVEGIVNWSPERDTVATLALSTSVEDSTTADVSGSVYYEASGTVTRDVRANLETRLSGAVGWRTYYGALPEETILRAGAGFTWWLNRNLGLDGDVNYERSMSEEFTDDELYVGLGLTLQK